MKCCITPVLRELRACSVVPGEKSEGDSPGLSSGAHLVPAGAQLNKTKHWQCPISSWSPSRTGFLSAKLWCAHRLLMWIFCFRVSSLFPFFNTLEFSKWEIIFCFSRQICCYSSRLSDIAGTYNKCLLLLMEIKLLGPNLARSIKN